MASRLNQFNGLARRYDRLAKIIFGNSLLEAQTAYLNEISSNANVLILGGGTGKLLTRLLNVNKSCSIWYIEASSMMIELARQHAKKANRAKVLFIHGTEDSIPGD